MSGGGVPGNGITLTALASLVRSRQASPVEITTALLERIAAIDPYLQAYAAVTPEAALRQAKIAEAEIMRDRYRSPLHGIPLAIKDIIYTKDTPTCAGMPAYKGRVPPFDATVVDRLRTAGAVILGKATTTEGAGMFHHSLGLDQASRHSVASDKHDGR